MADRRGLRRRDVPTPFRLRQYTTYGFMNLFMVASCTRGRSGADTGRPHLCGTRGVAEEREDVIALPTEHDATVAGRLEMSSPAPPSATSWPSSRSRSRPSSSHSRLMPGPPPITSSPSRPSIWSLPSRGRRSGRPRARLRGRPRARLRVGRHRVSDGSISGVLVITDRRAAQSNIRLVMIMVRMRPTIHHAKLGEV